LALGLLFGTRAPSYVRTAFHKVRHEAQGAVPIQFEIDRAKQEIADLEPAIHQNIEALARAEVDVEHLDREIAATRENLRQEKEALLALKNTLKSGDLIRTGNVTYTADEVKGELARRYDHYKQVGRILEEKETTLKARQKTMAAARQQLTTMVAQKKTLMTKVEGIEARLKMIEATQASNEFTFDDTALARAKQTVAELDKRLDVLAKVAEQEGRYAEKGMPVVIEPGRDVVKEIDAEFGGSDKGPDKSL